MIAKKFPQHNCVLGENQEEYQNLPAWFGQVGPEKEHTGFVFCYELSSDELNVINHTKQIWSSQLTSGQRLNPVNMMVHDPFEPIKEYPEADKKGLTARETEMLQFLEMILNNQVMPMDEEIHRFITQIRNSI